MFGGWRPEHRTLLRSDQIGRQHDLGRQRQLPAQPTGCVHDGIEQQPGPGGGQRSAVPGRTPGQRGLVIGSAHPVVGRLQRGTLLGPGLGRLGLELLYLGLRVAGLSPGPVGICPLPAQLAAALGKLFVQVGDRQFGLLGLGPPPGHQPVQHLDLASGRVVLARIPTHTLPLQRPDHLGQPGRPALGSGQVEPDRPLHRVGSGRPLAGLQRVGQVGVLDPPAGGHRRPEGRVPLQRRRQGCGACNGPFRRGECLHPAKRRRHLILRQPGQHLGSQRQQHPPDPVRQHGLALVRTGQLHLSRVELPCGVVRWNCPGRPLRSRA